MLRRREMSPSQLKAAAAVLALAFSTGCIGLTPPISCELPGLMGQHGPHPGCGAACEPFDDAAWDEGSPQCSEACDGDSPGFHGGVAQAVWTPAQSLADGAAQMFGHVANFCVPAAAIGPPEIPPPGRFHPVPTNPVFAPGQ